MSFIWPAPLCILLNLTHSICTCTWALLPLSHSPLRCGNNKGEMRHRYCFLNHTSFFWIYCQDLFFGRDNKKGQTGTQLQVCSYNPHRCFVWWWMKTWGFFKLYLTIQRIFYLSLRDFGGELLSCCFIGYIWSCWLLGWEALYYSWSIHLFFSPLVFMHLCTWCWKSK